MPTPTPTGGGGSLGLSVDPALQIPLLRNVLNSITLAVSITGDPGMGRGFFYTSDPLRDVDPVGIEKKWPDDADGEPHDEGEIIGETLYDLRKELQTRLGTDAGFTKFLAIFDGELQRSAATVVVAK